MAGPSTTQELLRTVALHGAVMEAFVNGKPVQIKDLGSDKWEDCPAPSWNKDREYRVKQEPRKIFVHVFSDGSVTAFTQKGLDRYVPELADRAKYAEYVEVIK